VFATSACDSSDFIREDLIEVNDGTTALTGESSYSAEIAFNGMAFTVSDLMTSGGTSDLDAQTLTLDGDCVAGTTFYYALSSTESSNTAAT